MLLDSALPKKTNKELKELVDRNDTETIILCHLKLASSLARKYGRDDEYFDAAIFGLVLGVERLKDLEHGNITGYLVWWMHRYLKEVKTPLPEIEYDVEQPGDVSIDEMIESLSSLDKSIIIMRYMNFTNDEIYEYLEIKQWAVHKAKNKLKRILKL